MDYIEIFQMLTRISILIMVIMAQDLVFFRKQVNEMSSQKEEVVLDNRYFDKAME